jgi:SAM-dependent methyltransferase
VIRFLTLHRPQHIYDFGCGSGEMTCRLGYRNTGLDVSPDLISVARERAALEGVSENVKFIVADGASVDISDGTFDAMLAMSVVHHMPVRDAIDAIDRLLCPGGRVAFLEPVAYSKALQWVRDRSPRRKDTSPNERQLSADEVLHIGKRFVIEEQRHFYLLSRLRRLLPRSWYCRAETPLGWLDQMLLSIPGVKHFAGVVAILARSRK